jgi:hypothetical protein
MRVIEQGLNQSLIEDNIADLRERIEVEADLEATLSWTDASVQYRAQRGPSPNE